MQDSDITSGFTPGADIYAAYVLSDTGEGHNNYTATVARFPSAKHLSICTRFNATAQCLDFEAGTTGISAGDAQQCVQWVQRMRALGFEPSVYVQLSLWDWLAGVFNAAGVPQPGWWVAHWTNVAHLEPGSDATQWQGGSLVDRNTAADYWPTVDDGLSPSGGGTPIPGGNVTDPNDPQFISLLTNIVALLTNIETNSGNIVQNTFGAEQKLDVLNTEVATTNGLLTDLIAAVKAVPGGGTVNNAGPASGTYTYTPEASA